MPEPTERWYRQRKAGLAPQYIIHGPRELGRVKRASANRISRVQPRRGNRGTVGGDGGSSCIGGRPQRTAGALVRLGRSRSNAALPQCKGSTSWLWPRSFSYFWGEPSTAHRALKRMVRLLIEDITRQNGERIQLDGRFRGGMSKTLRLPRPLNHV
jgi:hypothetical protein